MFPSASSIFNRILIVAFPLLTIIHPYLNAQWTSFGNDIVPVDHRLSALKIAADSSIWIISVHKSVPTPSTEQAKVTRSVNIGATWNTANIPETFGQIGYDISPLDRDHAFAAVAEAGLFETTDGGASWSQITTYPYKAEALHFFNDMEGWVFGLDPSSITVMSVTSDGGATWTHAGGSSWTQPPGMSLPDFESQESLLSGYTTSSGVEIYEESIYITTWYGDYWHSPDKGYNWARKWTPFADMNRNISSIAAKDNQTIMIASDFVWPSLGEPTISYTTFDGGESWEIEGSPGITPSAIHHLPDTDSIFIMTGPFAMGVNTFGTSISYNSGKDWELIGSDIRVSALAFINKDLGIGACLNTSSFFNGIVARWNFDVSTATKKIEQEQLHLFPNPVRDKLLLHLNLHSPLEPNIEIVNMFGQVVLQRPVGRFSGNTQQIPLDVSSLDAGVYFLRVYDNGKSISRKFIKV